MKKTFRKAIAVLLAVLMVAFSVPFSALAGTPDAPDMFGETNYTVTKNRKWWVDDGVDTSLSKLQSTPEYWSYNSDETYNQMGSWSLSFGGRFEDYGNSGYEDHRNDYKPVIAATVSSQGTNAGMKEAIAKVKDKSDTNAIKNYAASYFQNYYGMDASHTYEAVKTAKNILNPATLKAGDRILSGLFLSRKNIWIVYEKFCKMAQDNGYYFFKYCMENLDEKEKKNIYYVIDKRSDEYKNVEKYGKHVIDFMSVKHMLYIMSMSICISSDSKSHLYAWRTKPSLVKRAIGKKKELFLQHGVTALKQVHQLFGKNGTSSMEYFVTTGRVEQEIAINELGYNEKTAPITGFARWDVLEDKQSNKEKFILLMPTWRSWLEEVSDNQFLVSDYYKKYSSLLQSPRLNQILKDTNTRLIFYIHPKFAGYIDNFKAAVSNRVTYIPFGKIPLNELMMRCSMLITDYSSVCWDVYYMDKPVLFYQFDYDMYNQAHGSYINMENDLFGNRSTTEDALLNDVEYFANNGFVENEKDRIAAPKYFEYRDNNNSKRIYDFLKNNGF